MRLRRQRSWVSCCLQLPLSHQAPALHSASQLQFRRLPWAPFPHGKDRGVLQPRQTAQTAGNSWSKGKLGWFTLSSSIWIEASGYLLLTWSVILGKLHETLYSLKPFKGCLKIKKYSYEVLVTKTESGNYLHLLLSVTILNKMFIFNVIFLKQSCLKKSSV